MKRLLIILCAMLSAFVAIAQNTTVKGTVVDEENAPMPGAIVVAKSAKDASTRSSTTTDVQGKYSISCVVGDILEFHFMGYVTASEKVGSKKIIDVKMAQDAAQKLEDAVVIGYGSVKMADLTGSVVNVKMGNVKEEPILSIEQALQGRVAGLEITTSDGEPGSEAVMRIRGSRSIDASNEPLIVVDGVMDAVPSLSDIHPSDIESVTVLKDASSTAIYGSRGSNGVILINTKGANDQQLRQRISLNFKAQAGVAMLPRNLDLMNATEFGIYRNEYYQHSGTSSKYNNQTPISGLSVKNPFDRGETDWIRSVSRVAPYQNYHLALNAFQGKQKIYASLSYNDEQGIIKKSGKQNYTANLIYNNAIFDWLNLRATVRYQYRTQENNATKIGGTGIYNSAIYLSPLIDPANSYNPLNNAGTAQSNPVVMLNENIDNTTRSMLSMSVQMEAKFWKYFKFKTKFYYYYFDRKRYIYNPSTLPSRTEKQAGYAKREDYAQMNYYVENTLSYSQNYKGGHHVDAMLGHMSRQYDENLLSLSGEGFLIDAMKWNTMGSVADKDSYTASSNNKKKTLISFFGRVNYNWKSRYYLTLTGRYDGASNFAVNHKWGFFPSMALKWNAAKEPFMENVTWVDNLSLRFSVGSSGNDLSQPYLSHATLSSSSDSYPFGGSQQLQYWLSRIASPNLTWETTTNYNLAIDAAFLNNRIEVSLEGYIAKTRDLLLSVKTPQHTGSDSRRMNIGRTTNKGIELTLSTRNIVKRNFSWDTDLTIATASSIVDDLGPEAQISSKNSPLGGYMMCGYRKGYPVNAFWGFEYAGVWNNQEEIDRNKVTHALANDAGSTKLGYPVYVDQNHDGTLDHSDIVFLGSSDPIVSGGLQNTFRIRNFRLGVFFNYAIGGKVWNFSEFYMAGSRRTNQYKYMINAYHPIKNPTSELPRAGIIDGAFVPSSFMVHDASFLRLKSLTVGYRWTLKSKALREIEISASGDNLYLWSNYNGFDPDVSSGGVKHLDQAAYPKPTKVVFSINLVY